MFCQGQLDVLKYKEVKRGKQWGGSTGLTLKSVVGQVNPFRYYSKHIGKPWKDFKLRSDTLKLVF